MKLVLRAAGLGLGAAVFASVAGGCYSGGGGTDPPTNEFYFPVGLAVSRGGNVLYAVNSDFDLQWSGGTLQSYDLYAIRHDAAVLASRALAGQTFPGEYPGGVSACALGQAPQDVFDSTVCGTPVNTNLVTWPTADGGGLPCFASAPLPVNNGTSIGQLPGTNCAPPFESQPYQANSVIIGAFATDLQLSSNGQRLFAPVRGSATVTWADLPFADLPPTQGPDTQVPSGLKDPLFDIQCTPQPNSSGRCTSLFQTGDDPNSIANSRMVTMPGEPFGLAQTEDGTAMIVTSQTNTEVSLLTTGIGPPVVTYPSNTPMPPPPTMQFVAGGVDNGGNGIAVIPHDPAVVNCVNPGPGQVCVQPAFLQTSRAVPNLDLLRYYSDDGSTLHRPYLQVENKFGITSISGGGSDSRGIAIDATDRIACKASGGSPIDCGKLPAYVYFANRSANVLAIATVGDPSLSGDRNYDPDLVAFLGNVPVSNGPSRVYVAPIVNAAGQYEIRVFVVCFDSNQIVIYDPSARTVEKVINVGVGPYAIAFDPFSLTDAATHATVPIDPRYPGLSLRTYRFAYVASFTQSYVQVLDLDNTPQTGSGLAGSATFEQVVFTVGNPTPPKGQ